MRFEPGEPKKEKQTISNSECSGLIGSVPPPSTADIFLNVYFDLAETRKIAENASDKFLLYLIDMAIFHVSETLSATQHPAVSAPPLQGLCRAQLD